MHNVHFVLLIVVDGGVVTWQHHIEPPVIGMMLLMTWPMSCTCRFSSEREGDLNFPGLTDHLLLTFIFASLNSSLLSILHSTSLKTAPFRSTAVMASPSPAAAAPTGAVFDPPKHDLHPVQVKTSSPRFPPQPSTPNSIYYSFPPSLRRIGIAVDLSEESAYAVKWAVDDYLRPGDIVILLHVRSTSVLYGADWGSSTPTATTPSNVPPLAKTTSPRKLEEEFDKVTLAKANQLAQPLVDSHVPVKIHIVKDHDMKERLCLEVERLGLSAVIMGSRGIGASRERSKGKLGSVSDYCVQHCSCPVVVVRYNKEEKAAAEADDAAEEQNEFHDAVDQPK